MIDQYADTNTLKNLSPKIKVSYSLLLIILALMSDNAIIHSLILLLNTFLIGFIAKIKLKAINSIKIIFGSNKLFEPSTITFI